MRLPGVMPRRRMSSVKDVIVSSCAIFGSLTNVPAAVTAHEQALADELVERRADREPRDAEIRRTAGARTGSPRRRRAARSGRAPGSRVSLCFVPVRRHGQDQFSADATGTCSVSSGRLDSAASARAGLGVEEVEARPGRPRARAVAPAVAAERGSTRAVKSVVCSASSAVSSASLAEVYLGTRAPRPGRTRARRRRAPRAPRRGRRSAAGSGRRTRRPRTPPDGSPSDHAAVRPGPSAPGRAGSARTPEARPTRPRRRPRRGSWPESR